MDHETMQKVNFIFDDNFSRGDLNDLYWSFIKTGVLREYQVELREKYFTNSGVTLSLEEYRCAFFEYYATHLVDTLNEINDISRT